MKRNIVLQVDSYKMSHDVGIGLSQYPKGADGYFGYGEARGCDGDEDSTMFFGLQMFIKEYLLTPFTMSDINEAEEFAIMHGEPFNRKGWEYILTVYRGFIPVTIKAVPEGKVIPLSNALWTVECTDPMCFWVGSSIETMIHRGVWYPTTVATNSRECRKIIKKYLDMTSDNPNEQLPFKLHDFGARGVSSHESAEIGGAAHLATGAMGSDTIEGIRALNFYYNAKMSGYSIPASEHSTITSWGREGEVDAYRNMLKLFGKKGAIFACVSDSYDIFNACENIWGGVLKQEVIDSGATLVIRPDSGDPVTVINRVIEILGRKFGYTKNSKGYNVLNTVRIIQGDGVDRRSIKEILGNLEVNKWSADNIAFGSGGALLQKLDRDKYKFAMKCSSIRINGEWKDVSKNPITDPGKKSKSGRLTLWNVNGLYVTDSINKSWGDDTVEVLVPVYRNGQLLKEYNLEEVRENSKI